jgi:ATP-dependent DNA helicase UvrD/PcrA
MSIARYLNGLNAEQRLAVEHGVAGPGPNIAGPLLVIAGAGSGKTNTLAHRVAHLMVHGAEPSRILLLTFSRRAASEMQRRVDRIVAAALGEGAGGGRSSMPWSGTFHAVGARLLRMYAHAIGLDPAFTIHDREDSADLMNLMRHELGLSDKPQRFPLKATCLAIYSRAVNATLPLDRVLAKQFPWCAEWKDDLQRLFGAYVEAKQRQGVLDYDDLLLYWSELMAVPELAVDVGGQFDHVLVDEYQDTNALQAKILLRLKPTGSGLTVVGDDAQAIYGFRAATVRNILDFPAHFVPPARVVTLEQNYRSIEPILTASNAVIGLARERFTKNLRSQRGTGARPALITVSDDAAQVDCVVGAILENREAGTPLKEQAVLFRTAHHSAMLEIELARRNIPFVKYGGLKFLEAAHIKDVLAFLRWTENPRDRVTGFRVVQLLPGVGPATAARILDRMAEHSDPICGLSEFTPPAGAFEHWSSFVETVCLVRGKLNGWPAELDLICRWYAPHLERIYEDAPVRQNDLAQLGQIAFGYSSRERFLTELTLDPPDATSDQAGVPLLDEDYLILSTIHSAKGQEWKSVFILNAVDGCLPSDLATGSSAEIEEERRLLYVAMTRAKDNLHLIVPQRFFAHLQMNNGDRHMYASRTRFIPDDILDNFEICFWPFAAEPTPEAVISHEQIDIGARLRRRWR